MSCAPKMFSIDLSTFFFVEKRDASSRSQSLRRIIRSPGCSILGLLAIFATASSIRVVENNCRRRHRRVVAAASVPVQNSSYRVPYTPRGRYHFQARHSERVNVIISSVFVDRNDSAKFHQRCSYVANF